MLKGRQLCSLWPDLVKIKLIQAYMHVLVSCKNEEDPINPGASSSQKFSHCKSMWIFTDVQGQLTPQFFVEI